jgi:hypothetical protein
MEKHGLVKMTQQLVTVRFTVPLSDRSEAAGGPLIFTHWMPLGSEHGIKFQHDGCTGLLWLNSTPWNDDQASIERTVNVLVDTIVADIVTSVSADLTASMKVRDCGHAGATDQRVLADAYVLHGNTVLAALDYGLNRFLSFVRIEKGQHWLRHVMLDPGRLASHAVRFRAQASTDGSDWFRWCPTNIISLTAHGPNENDPRFIRPTDWPNAQEYVLSNKKPTLTLELLTGAESLASEGRARASLAEGVSALEVALSRFAQSGRIDELLPSSVRSRLVVGSLPGLVQRIGLTASVALVLPFIFPADQLSSDVLATCREAIAERQTVVHQGQRDVDLDKLEKYLTALRKICELLLRHSET